MSYYVIFRMLKHPAHQGGPTKWMLKGHGTSRSNNDYQYADEHEAAQEASHLRLIYGAMGPETKVEEHASERLAKLRLKELNA